MPPRTLMYKMYRWQFPRDYNQILDIALEKILKSICILGILIIILLFIACMIDGVNYVKNNLNYLIRQTINQL